MPKLKPDASEARRVTILVAAERCFRTKGFHQTSIKDICVDGGFSPGALYLYFPSKEALIEGLISSQMANARDLLVDLPDQLDLIGNCVDLPGAWVDEARASDSIAINADIIAEALRNPRVAALMVEDNQEVQDIFATATKAAQKRGEIPDFHNPDAIAALLLALSDGLMIRHLLNPAFDASGILSSLRALFGQDASGKLLSSKNSPASPVLP
jgi:TetR/AcrR family transcriptional regulator, repressor for uid operon